jgi:hypothetical protein
VDDLGGEADEVHLDPAGAGVVERAVTEAARTEVRPQLAVDPLQEIEVEARRDAQAIVVGGLERRAVFHEIDADQERAPGAGQSRRAGEEDPRLRAREVPDRRARKVDGPPRGIPP